jgi:spore maturation protein A
MYWNINNIRKKELKIMDKIWGFMIISSFGIAIFNGRLQQVITALFESAHSAVQMCINLIGILCLWSGFVKIADKCGIIQKISRVANPIIKLLFPKLPKNSEVNGHIAMNMTANFLGLGNIATPMGLKAMVELQKLNSNKNVVSDEMLMFLILNTASIQIIPTSAIALRTTYGSTNPTAIVIPTIIASFISVIIGVIIIKLYTKIWGAK